MSNEKLFSVGLEIRTSPLFVAGAALLLLGVKVQPDQDLGKISRIMIEAGYIHWLRDAAQDEHVATLMHQAKEAAENAERDHGVEPDFESCVRVFATDLLNYYGGFFGIEKGLADSKAKADEAILKSMGVIRNLDHLREHVESSMTAEQVAKADSIRDRLNSGEINTEEALREAGAPEELVQLMAGLERQIKGTADTAEA